MSRSVNTKIMMIACVCPISSSTDHSINTLRYANRLKEKPNKNYDNPPSPQQIEKPTESPTSDKGRQRAHTSSSNRKAPPFIESSHHKEEQKQQEHLPVINSGSSASNIKKPHPVANGGASNPSNQLPSSRQPPASSNNRAQGAPSSAWSKRNQPGISVESNSKRKGGSYETPSTKNPSSFESSETEEEDGNSHDSIQFNCNFFSFSRNGMRKLDGNSECHKAKRGHGVHEENHDKRARRSGRGLL